MRRAVVWRLRRTSLQRLQQQQQHRHRHLTSAAADSASNDASAASSSAPLDLARSQQRKEAWPSLTERLLRSRQAVLANLTAPDQRPLYKPLNGRTTRVNALMRSAAHRGDLAAALNAAATLLVPYRESFKGKERAARPDVNTYEALIAAYAHHGLYQQALDCLEDAKAAGIELNAQCRNQIIRAHVNADVDVGPVLQEMQLAGIRSTPETLHHRLRQHVVRKNVEGAILLACEAVESARSGSGPISDVIKRTSLYSVAQMAASAGEVAVATSLLQAWDSSLTRDLVTSTSTLQSPSCTAKTPHDPGILIDLLRTAVDADESSCTRYLLDELRYTAKSTTPPLDLALLISEGMTNEVLLTLSRDGDVESMQFLLDAHMPILLGHLPGDRQGKGLAEWQVTNVITTNIVAGQFKAAIECFEHYLSESLGLPSNKISENARKLAREPLPKYHVFSEGLEGHVDRVAAAVDYVIQNVSTPGSKLPTQFVNAVIRAALATDREAIRCIEPTLLREQAHLQLDADTFRFLFQSCTPLHKASNVEQAAPSHGRLEQPADIDRLENLLQHMRQRGDVLRPDSALYHTLISVFVQAPLDDVRWQNAFDYLEEMKHADILPSVAAYSALLKRLYAEEQARRAELTEEQQLLGEPEDPRIHLLIREMAALGYLGGRVSNSVQRLAVSRDLRELIGRERLQIVREQMLSPTDRKGRMASDRPRQDRQGISDHGPRRSNAWDREVDSAGSAVDRIRDEQASRFRNAEDIDSLQNSLAKMPTLNG